MIAFPTHKRFIKAPLNTQRPFTSLHLDEWIIVTVQIHSRKKLLKGLKITTAKWTSTQCVVTLDNKIKCLSFAVFSFGNPTNKIVTGTAYTRGLLNSKPPGPIIMIDQSEILSRQSGLIHYTVFILRCIIALRLLPATATCTNVVQKKTNFLRQTGTFWHFPDKLYFLESHTERRWGCSNNPLVEGIVGLELSTLDLNSSQPYKCYSS
jgi:hypothetical protein